MVIDEIPGFEPGGDAKKKIECSNPGAREGRLPALAGLPKLRDYPARPGPGSRGDPFDYTRCIGIVKTVEEEIGDDEVIFVFRQRKRARVALVVRDLTFANAPASNL